MSFLLMPFLPVTYLYHFYYNYLPSKSNFLASAVNTTFTTLNLSCNSINLELMLFFAAKSILSLTQKSTGTFVTGSNQIVCYASVFRETMKVTTPITKNLTNFIFFVAHFPKKAEVVSSFSLSIVQYDNQNAKTVHPS